MATYLRERHSKSWNLKNFTRSTNLQRLIIFLCLRRIFSNFSSKSMRFFIGSQIKTALEFLPKTKELNLHLGTYFLLRMITYLNKRNSKHGIWKTLLHVRIEHLIKFTSSNALIKVQISSSKGHKGWFFI